MKRFIVTILCATVLSIGLGAIVREAGASLKSDEKALAIIEQARIALGGEQALKNVQSIVIKGKTSRTFDIKGVEKTIDGETEIAMQMPDKFSKQVRLGDGGATNGVAHTVNAEVSDIIMVRQIGTPSDAPAGPAKSIVLKSNPERANTVVLNGEEVTLNGEDGEFTTADAKTIKVRVASRIEGETAPATGRVTMRSNANGEVIEDRIFNTHAEPARNNEMLRTALSLLLTPPAGMDVSYKFIGEESVDGEICSIIEALSGGSSTKLFISNSSKLPIMASFNGMHIARVVTFSSKDMQTTNDTVSVAPVNDEIVGDTVQTVRFSDYRTVGGVQLPYKWTSSVSGKTIETYEISSYELNPAGIADKFKEQKVFHRTTMK